VQWIGIVDPQLRSFFGREFLTPRGTTFNSYLILDERIACIASLRGEHIASFIENIERHVDPVDIDYLVLNQIELNDGAALRVLRRLMPSAQLLIPAGKGIPMHEPWAYRELQRGEALSLGSRELVLLEAHGIPWPGSMILYVPDQGLLLSQHLFAQHMASAHPFDDQTDPSGLMDRALRYYVSLLAPAYEQVRQTVESIHGWEVPFEMIAPANGVIWRAAPSDILSAYLRWTDRLPESRAVVVYETMLKSTEYMAEAVASGITAEGIPCSLRRVSLSDKEDILGEIFRAAAVLLGSPTVHRGILPSLAPLLQSVRSLGLRDRIGSAFGSYGWSGESRTQLEQQLQACGICIAEKGVYAPLRPSSSDLQRCRQLGRSIAARLKLH